MIIAKEIKLKYEYLKPYLETLGQMVNQILLSFCEREHFAYTWRYKSVESLSEKIETGRYKSWDDIDDFFASTIILPNLNKEKPVLDFIKKSFIQVELRKRGSTLKPPEVFRFDSTRVICRFRSKDPKISDDIKNINFEVQIKSAFEHAWSEATYSLAYKANVVDWKNIRLASQLKAAVEQLDMLISGAESISKHIVKHKWPIINTKIKLIKFVESNIEKGKIPEEVSPYVLTRFCDNTLALVQCFKGYRKTKINESLKQLLILLNKELENYDIRTFPRSISLFQFVWGVIVKNDLIDLKKCEIIPLITSEMETIFPEVKNIKRRFKYQ